MDNIIDQLKSLVSSQLVSHTASAVGETESGVSKGLDGIFPLLLGGLMKKSAENHPLDGAVGAIKETPAPETLVNNPSDLLGTLTGSGGLANSANRFLSSVLGDKTQEASSFIANYAGIKSTSASSLLTMAAPLIMGFLSNKLGSGGLSASSLGNYLSGQKNNIVNAAPAGIGSLLGLGSLENLGNEIKTGFSHATTSTTSAASAAAARTGAATNRVPPPAQPEAAKKSYLMPILAFIVLVLVVLFLLRSCNSDKATQAANETAQNTSTTMQNAANSASNTVSNAADSVKNALGAFFKKVLPNGTELNIPDLGIENKLIKFIEDKNAPVDANVWFTFDRLTFESNSANLKPESQEQLKNIAEIMKAYPAVEIKLGGYTDNTGDAQSNLKLSQDRANSVRQDLITLGVADTRVTAEGFGQDHPVAGNDTEEGRAKNRRIDVNVTKK